MAVKTFPRLLAHVFQSAHPADSFEICCLQSGDGHELDSGLLFETQAEAPASLTLDTLVKINSSWLRPSLYFRRRPSPLSLLHRLPLCFPFPRFSRPISRWFPWAPAAAAAAAVAVVKVYSVMS